MASKRCTSCWVILAALVALVDAAATVLAHSSVGWEGLGQEQLAAAVGHIVLINVALWFFGGFIASQSKLESSGEHFAAQASSVWDRSGERTRGRRFGAVKRRAGSSSTCDPDEPDLAKETTPVALCTQPLPPPVQVAGQRVYMLDTPEYAKEACRQLLKVSGAVVAVDCEGVKLSKEGELCLVQIATATGEVFVFDICILGAMAFESGLKELFENSEVLKVFQDARQDVDALHWQYGVSVQPIWDTQVADMVHRRLMSNNCQWVAGLPKLLEKHCPQHLASARILEIKKDVNDQVNEHPELWRQRPLELKMLEYAVLDVSVLLPLKVQLTCALCRAAQYRLRVDQLNASVRALSQVYSRFFKEKSFACHGREFARFPEELLHDTALAELAPVADCHASGLAQSGLARE